MLLLPFVNPVVIAVGQGGAAYHTALQPQRHNGLIVLCCTVAGVVGKEIVIAACILIEGSRSGFHNDFRQILVLLAGGHALVDVAVVCADFMHCAIGINACALGGSSPDFQPSISVHIGYGVIIGLGCLTGGNGPQVCLAHQQLDLLLGTGWVRQCGRFRLGHMGGLAAASR